MAPTKSKLDSRVNHKSQPLVVLQCGRTDEASPAFLFLSRSGSVTVKNPRLLECPSALEVTAPLSSSLVPTAEGVFLVKSSSFPIIIEMWPGNLLVLLCSSSKVEVLGPIETSRGSLIRPTLSWDCFLEGILSVVLAEQALSFSCASSAY